MADKVPLTRHQQSQRFFDQILFGMANNGTRGAGMGAGMGFMGLPFQTRQSGGKGSSGPWMTVDPRTQTVTPGFQIGGQGGGLGGQGGGQGGGNGNGGGGGNDPGTDPNNPDSAMLKAGLPSWWVDWLHTNGQYGVWNKPPAGGLLD